MSLVIRLFIIGRRLKIYRCFLLFIFFPNQLFAQLWNGNLGQPVLNVTFGAGASAALPSDATSYAYANGCPSEGQYSIEHLLPGCFGDTWTVLVGDYTHDVDGNYMLVNGSSGSGTVLQQKVNGLCGNTTYQFAAFLTNCMKNTACGGLPALPNITFTVEASDGTILESYNTGDLPISETRYWVEYGVCYTTPVVPVPIVLRITSNGGGSCGSAFVIDNVSLKPAGPGITLTLDGKKIQNIDLCSDYTNPMLLEAHYTTGFIDPVMHWQKSVDAGKTWEDIPGAGTNTYIMPRRKTGIVAYRFWMAQPLNAAVPGCTINSETIVTNIHPVPDPLSKQQLLGCVDKDLVLHAPANFASYDWKGPNGFQSNQQLPVIKNVGYPDAGFYTVLATNDFGCTVLDSFQLTVSPAATISADALYEVCEGTPVNLSANGDGTFVWTPATFLSNANIADPVAIPADSIQYKVVLTNNYGCKDSALVDINVFKKPVADAGPDKTILAGDTVVLGGSVLGTSVVYHWTSAGAITANQVLHPSFSPLAETTYILQAESTVGCGSASSAVTVHVYKDLIFPLAFSPNGDGLNDVYHVLVPDNYTLVSFTIFNRSGNKVFHASGDHPAWDGTYKGKPLETGNYVYYLDMKHAFGKKINRRGNILLLR